MDQGHPLAGGGEIAAVAQDVAVAEESLDDGGARGGSAETPLAHRLAELLILDKLARSFHGAEQGRFVEAGGWTGLGLVNLDGIGACTLKLGRGAGDGNQHLGVVITRGLLTVDGEPTGIGQDFPLALERLSLDAGDAGGDIKASGGVEDRDEALGDHQEKLCLHLVESGGGSPGRDDGMVVGDLGVVEDLAGFDHPILFQSMGCVLP